MSSEQDASTQIELEALEKCFYAKRVLPVAQDLFDRKIPSIDKIINECLVVLDTNVLLVPYAGRKMSTNEIIDVYKKIKSQKRLYIPAQVSREFTKNRPLKIGEMHKSILDKLSKINVSVDISYSALEGIEDYARLKEAISDMASRKTEIDKIKNSLIKNIQKWVWKDPVSIEYSKIFTSNCIVEPEFNEEEEYKACKERYALNIPPGYKDASKPDGGIGDYLIWKTILHLGKTYSMHLVFVTGDEKADWQHRSGDHPLMPRYELFDEYWRSSNGKAFYICPLSDFFEYQNASSELVEEVRSEEASLAQSKIFTKNISNVDFDTMSKIYNLLFIPSSSEDNGLVRSEDVDIEFHSKEISHALTPDKCYTKEEIISCPVCDTIHQTTLGMAVSSTRWFFCKICKTKFAIHRLRSGDFRISQASIR